MSKVLEIFGKGITVNITDVICHWIHQMISQESSENADSMHTILDSLANRETIQAKEQIVAYLKQCPECVFGRLAASAVCLLEGDLQEVIKQTQSVYWRQPSNTMALYILGYVHERLGHIEQAVEFYQDCVKFKSYLQLPRQRMSAIYLKEGQIDRAVKEYEILTSEHPDDISSIILLGYLYLVTKNLPQAIETFNLGILSHPDNFTGSLKDDDIQSMVECGMYEQALDTIRDSIEQFGATEDLWIRMGDVYSQWEKESEAIVCYEYASRIQPSSLEAAIKLGTHYLRNQRFSLAAEQFNHASQMNDDILDAYMGLAIAQNQSGLDIEALQTLSLASSIQKNSILLTTEATALQFQSVLDGQIDSQAESDKPVVTTDNIIQAYKEQLKRYKNRADIYYKYAVLLMGEEDYTAAAEYFERALRLHPVNHRAMHNLVICMYENSQTDKVIEKLAIPDTCGTSDFEKYYQLAMLYTDKRALAKAVKKLCKTQSSGTYEKTEMRTTLEDILQALGVVDRSYTSWDRINEASACMIKLFDKKDFINETGF